MGNYKRVMVEVDSNPNEKDREREVIYVSKLHEAVTREELPHEPYHSTDVIMERLNDASFRFTPNKLLSTD